MNYKPGDKITIKINGEEIETRIDGRDVQRLPCDKGLAITMEGQYNWLWRVHQLGYISKKKMRKIYQNVGYSVCGYSEIFPKDEIENPLWGDDSSEPQASNSTRGFITLEDSFKVVVRKK